MNRPSPIPALLLAAAVLAAVAGCDGNKSSTMLLPTGIRPAPETWPGSLTGAVFFDPVNTPDLGSPPFPPTRVELYRGSELVGVDSLESDSRNYLFTGLAPASYSIVVRSSAFYPNSRGSLPVHEDRLDAGNITLTINPTSFSNSIDVMGSMPGFDTGQFYMGTTSLDQNVLGVWTYPNSLMPDLIPYVAIPAGTYRLKFVNDFSSTDSNLIGWGGNPSDTLAAPVTNHLAVRGSGPSTDIVVRFPSSGVYAFTLDERRQTFSIALTSLAPPARPRRLP
jgi:hypothetical protein